MDAQIVQYKQQVLFNLFTLWCIVWSGYVQIRLKFYYLILFILKNLNEFRNRNFITQIWLFFLFFNRNKKEKVGPSVSNLNHHGLFMYCTWHYILNKLLSKRTNSSERNSICCLRNKCHIRTWFVTFFFWCCQFCQHIYIK